MNALHPGRKSWNISEAVLCYKAYTAGDGSAGNDDVKVTAMAVSYTHLLPLTDLFFQETLRLLIK